LPQELLLSALLLATGQGTFNALLKAPHGRLRMGHQPGDFLGERVVTTDGRVDLAPRALLDAARSLDADYDAEVSRRHRLKLVTRRRVTTHNSWTHNLEDFVSGEQGTNYLYIHPDDAGHLGLEESDLVDVSTETGTVRVPIRFLVDLTPGTVALPHGWGHQHARGLSIANKTRGVNVNLLASSGPNKLERVSGMAHLTGIVVDIVKARGAKSDETWSGLSEETGA
jgi:anaerobic selenocysteine-containing dehydrogenase